MLQEYEQKRISTRTIFCFILSIDWGVNMPGSALFRTINWGLLQKFILKFGINGMAPAGPTTKIITNK